MLSNLLRHRQSFSSPLVLLLLIAVPPLICPIELSAKDKDSPQPRPTERATPFNLDSPSQIRDIPSGFLFHGDDYVAEFLPEGVIWKWGDGTNQYAFWVVEVRGSRGQIFWTRSKESGDFRIDGDRILYERTTLIHEMYEGDREGVTQFWYFEDNPLWEGGNLEIVGELLTKLQVRVEEGMIQFYDGEEKWAGSFFEINATDRNGRLLALSPNLDGKTVSLSVPATWLYELNSASAEDR